MVEAYVLIQSEQGKMEQIADQVVKIDGVDDAVVVTGPYDVIAHVTADDIDAIGKLIVSKIQVVGGVIRTLTCPVVRL